MHEMHTESQTLSLPVVAAVALALAAPTLGGCANVIAEDIPDHGELSYRESSPSPRLLAEEGKTAAWEIGDVTVIHRQTPQIPVVSTRLYFVGGVGRTTERTQGLEALALYHARWGGTEERDPDEFADALAEHDASIGTFVTHDYSGFAMRSLRGRYLESLELFAELTLSPEMPHDLFYRLLHGHAVSLSRRDESELDRAQRIAHALLFEDHPYARDPQGTFENIKKFEPDHTRAFYRMLLEPNSMLLVVVGDVDRAKMLERLADSFGRLRSRGVPGAQFPEVDTTTRRLDAHDVDLGAGYLVGVFSAPEPYTRAFAALHLGVLHLANELFTEIRSEAHLAYAVTASVLERRTSSGLLFVAMEDVMGAWRRASSEIGELREGGLSLQALERARQIFTTQHYKSRESQSARARMLAAAQIYGGDWRLAERQIELYRSITPEEVQRAARKYIRNLQYGYVGDLSRLESPLVEDRVDVERSAPK
jgi:zinc protease